MGQLVPGTSGLRHLVQQLKFDCDRFQQTVVCVQIARQRPAHSQELHTELSGSNWNARQERSYIRYEGRGTARSIQLFSSAIQRSLILVNLMPVLPSRSAQAISPRACSEN